MEISDLLTVNVLMYILLFGAVIVVHLIERRDWECTNPYKLLEECHEGNGMPYNGSKPTQTDGCKDLLKKINIAAGAEQKSIKWRRSFILSVIICILVFGLVVMPGNLPYWPYMYAAIIISTFVLYFNFNYYSFHRYNRPTEYIKESIALLFEKISLGQC
jgi:hypothetical protein